MVHQYLESKFGEDLNTVTEAMRELVAAFDPEGLVEQPFAPYERFCPDIPKDRSGWGRKGQLRLDLFRSLAE